MNLLGKIIRKLNGSADLLRAAIKGSEVVASIEVFGSEEFRQAVKRALLLLHSSGLTEWDTMTRHFNSIIEGRETTVIVTAHPAFMFVNGPDWRNDPEVLAAVIAFMACSCRLHRTYEAEHPGRRVPREIFAGAAARERCNDAYRECLLALGKRPEEKGSRSDPYLN